MLPNETNLQPEPTKCSNGFKKCHLNYRIWGPKVRRTVDTYYTSEWALQLLLESNLDVKTYCEQFPKIDEYINGKRLRNIFTFWVDYWDGTVEIIQVVRKRNLVPNEIGEREPKRWSDICDWGDKQGFKCRFIVEGTEELKQKTLIENWAQVIHFIQSGIEIFEQDLANRIHSAVNSREVLRISDLSKVFPKEDPGELVQILFVLLHSGKVKINLSRKILNHSFEVEPTNEITHIN